MSFSRIFRRIRKLHAKLNQQKIGESRIKNLLNGVNQSQQEEETPEQKALREASAITDNGRVAENVSATSSQPVTVDNVDGLLEYVGDVRKRITRRRREGAPMINSKTLGQSSTLGV